MGFSAVSRRNHAIEEGSLWTGRGARGVVSQHFDRFGWILIDQDLVSKNLATRTG